MKLTDQNLTNKQVILVFIFMLVTLLFYQQNVGKTLAIT